jgi:toxin ParE1/3/4
LRVLLTAGARRNLRDLANYIALDDPAAARRVTRKVLATLDILATFPNAGHEGRELGTRELGVPRLPYIIVYKIEGDAVWALRIFHGEMRWPPAEEE